MTVTQVVLAAGFASAVTVLYKTIGPRWLVPVAALLAAAVLPVGLFGSTVLTIVALLAAAYVYRRRPAPATAPSRGNGDSAPPTPSPPPARRPSQEAPPAYTLAIGPLRQRIDIPLGIDEGHHALCVGASGWGKTWLMFTIIRAHLRAGFGCVVIEMKGSGEVVERLRLEAVLADLPFWHFSLDGGDRWNPLARGNRSELKDKLISSQHFSEEHYKRLYEHYLLQALKLLERRSDGGAIDLAGLLPLLDPSRLEGELRHLDDSATADELTAFLAGVTDQDRRALRGLANRLAVIVEGVQGEYLSAAGDPAELIDLARVVASGGVVVFSLNTSRYPETAQLMGNLVLQDLNAVSGMLESGERSTPPTLIAVDEFSGLAGTHVLNLFQRARSPRWSLLLLTQEVADLRRVRPTFHEEINANVELVVAGRQNNPESAEWLSKVAGTREVWRRSFALDRRGRPTGRGTMEAVHEPIVPPDAVMRLTRGDALIVRKRPNHDAGIGAVRPAGTILDRWPENTSREWILARAAHLRWLASRPEDRDGPGPLPDEPAGLSEPPRTGAVPPPRR